MTSIEFYEWKDHPVTKEIFAAWRIRQHQLVDHLVNNSALSDFRELQETAAAIKVYREILEMEAPE